MAPMPYQPTKEHLDHQIPDAFKSINSLMRQLKQDIGTLKEPGPLMKTAGLAQERLKELLGPPGGDWERVRNPTRTVAEAS